MTEKLPIDAPDKVAVRHHWEAESAGVRYGNESTDAAFYSAIEKARYALEPHIPEFAGFKGYCGKRVLEIGVGAGTDFTRWVKAGAVPTGIDITEAAIMHTRRRLDLEGIPPSTYSVGLGDAESLTFANDSFDLVYSWGVLHHTPDTPRAFGEALRVLKPGGTLKAMIYHSYSWTAWMLWMVYGLGRGRPWLSPRRTAFERLESPGTKLYSLAQARRLVESVGFADVGLRTVLGPGDLLLIKPSDRYRGRFWRVIWRVYPRPLIRLIGDRFGLYLLIEAKKPSPKAHFGS